MDDAIKEFLAKRKFIWLKEKLKPSMPKGEKAQLEQEAEEKFSMDHWLPDAARRVAQLSMVSHPSKFSHPGAKTSSIIAHAARKADGFLRTGNSEANPDVRGNAAALDVYKFLSLKFDDGKTLMEHVEQGSETAQQQLAIKTASFDEIQKGLLVIKQGSDTIITSGKVKQVYFLCGGGYHLLSILTPSDKWNAPFIRPSFVEEGRCRLDASLVVECQGLDKDEEDDAVAEIETLLYAGMKMAGGDILHVGKIEFLTVHDNKDLRKLTRKLMPGHVLIERRELMETGMAQGRDAIDALLDYLKVMHRSEQDADGNVHWNSKRRIPGWIVPVATGFHGITELDQAQNQRDPDTPHRFAESVVTLGEFVMPYRINELDDMLWHYHTDLENNLYLCQQNNRINDGVKSIWKEKSLG